MPDIPLHYRSASELGEMLRDKKISSVELTTLYLDRLEKQGASLNAVAERTADLALKQAQQADKELAAGKPRSPLHGVPYGAKDLLATAGNSDTLGIARAPRSGFRLRCDRDYAPARRGRGAGRQTGNGGTGGRRRIRNAGCFAARAGTLPLGRAALVGRLVVRLRFRSRGRSGGFRARLGNMGQYYGSRRVLRHFRPASHLWAREQARRDGPFVDTGQNRADGAVGGGLWAYFRSDCGPRPERCDERS